MKPLVSVVSSVYNGEDSVEESIQSVLDQQDVQLEMIVINDGSTDQTGPILDRMKLQNSNLSVVHQEHLGLTHSLVNGCNRAKGKYIARQDIGDLSLPGRLLSQVSALENDSSLVMVSCGTRFCDTDGDVIYDVVLDVMQANEGLIATEVEDVCGPPHHGSVVFKRDAYHQAGGYRVEFRVAQDLDLWFRLCEIGGHISLNEIYYQATLSPGSISFTDRRLQVELTKLIVEATRLRKLKLNEGSLLEQAKQLSERKNTGLYFDHCLAGGDDSRPNDRLPGGLIR